jgi:hypothetical protein
MPDFDDLDDLDELGDLELGSKVDLELGGKVDLELGDFDDLDGKVDLELGGNPPSAKGSARDLDELDLDELGDLGDLELGGKVDLTLGATHTIDVRRGLEPLASEPRHNPRRTSPGTRTIKSVLKVRLTQQGKDWQRRTPSANYMNKTPNHTLGSDARKAKPKEAASEPKPKEAASEPKPKEAASASKSWGSRLLSMTFSIFPKAPVPEKFMGLVTAFKGEFYKNGGPYGIQQTWKTICAYANMQCTASGTKKNAFMQNGFRDLLSAVSQSQTVTQSINWLRSVIDSSYGKITHFERAMILHLALVAKYPALTSIDSYTPPQMLTILQEIFQHELGADAYNGCPEIRNEDAGRKVLSSTRDMQMRSLRFADQHSGSGSEHSGSGSEDSGSGSEDSDSD